MARDRKNAQGARQQKQHQQPQQPQQQPQQQQQGGSGPRRRAAMADSATKEDQCHAKKVFVGGLLHRTTTQQLRDHFVRFGPIVDAVVLRWPDGRSRGFGYVTFMDADSAASVLKETHQIAGRDVDVKRAVPGIHKLFVGGLPQNTTALELRQYFEAFGIVSDAVVMIDPATNRSRGFGFVCFSPGPDGAAAVEAALGRYNCHQLRGKWIEVKSASPPHKLLAAAEEGQDETPNSTAPADSPPADDLLAPQQQQQQQARQAQQAGAAPRVSVAAWPSDASARTPATGVSDAPTTASFETSPTFPPELALPPRTVSGSPACTPPGLWPSPVSPPAPERFGATWESRQRPAALGGALPSLLASGVCVGDPKDGGVYKIPSPMKVRIPFRYEAAERGSALLSATEKGVPAALQRQQAQPQQPPPSLRSWSLSPALSLVEEPSRISMNDTATVWGADLSGVPPAVDWYASDEFETKLER